MKRLFHAQPLEPVLQHIGELAGRQSQTFVEWRTGDLLFLALGVDTAADEQFAEDRQITSRARLFQPANQATVRRLQLRAGVAIALGRHEGGE